MGAHAYASWRCHFYSTLTFVDHIAIRCSSRAARECNHTIGTGRDPTPKFPRLPSQRIRRGRNEEEKRERGCPAQGRASRSVALARRWRGAECIYGVARPERPADTPCSHPRSAEKGEVGLPRLTGGVAAVSKSKSSRVNLRAPFDECRCRCRVLKSCKARRVADDNTEEPRQRQEKETETRNNDNNTTPAETKSLQV